MQATEVDIAFVKPKDGLIALATVVLDDQLYLMGIAIHSKLVGSGYRLTSNAQGWRGSIQPVPSDPQAGWAHDRAGHVEKLKNY